MMANSYTSLVYHLIYAHKCRKPVITPEVARRLYPYKAGILKRLDGHPILIGGVADHVHVLTVLSPKRAVDAVVCSLKANSSRWAHEEFGLEDLDWQDGYGAFTVSIVGLEKAKEYIQRQEEHHRQEDYDTEFKRFLAMHEIAFDPRYI